MQKSDLKIFEGKNFKIKCLHIEYNQRSHFFLVDCNAEEEFTYIWFWFYTKNRIEHKTIEKNLFLKILFNKSASEKLNPTWLIIDSSRK